VLFVKNYLQFAADEDIDEGAENLKKDIAQRKTRVLAKRKLQFENAKTSSSENEPGVGKKKRHGGDSKKLKHKYLNVKKLNYPVST